MAMAGVQLNKIGIYLDDMLIFTDDPYLQPSQGIRRGATEAQRGESDAETLQILLIPIEVKYLGHQLSVQGIAMVPSYQKTLIPGHHQGTSKSSYT